MAYSQIDFYRLPSEIDAQLYAERSEHRKSACYRQQDKADCGGSESDLLPVQVPEAGWAGKKNSELLHLMIGAFDIFLTIDNNLEYQQHLIGQPVSFVVLAAKNNRFETLMPLMSEVRFVLKAIQSGQVIRIVEKPDQRDAE